jgi:hypothetical protein
VLKYLTKWFSEDEEERQHHLMRLARIEYARDWEYAYNMLMQNLQPGVDLQE